MAKHKKQRVHALHSDSKSASKLKRTPQAQNASKTAKKPNKSAQSTPKKTEPTIPFQVEDRVLLVGEGDFSFAKSIVEHHGCCDVTATCFDRQEELFEKYKPQAEEHVKYLEEEGQTVHYAIDATKLDKIKALKKRGGGRYDVILFNFPHVGGKSKEVNRQVRFNQELLVKFFNAGQELLASDGTIVVTLFEGEPYTLWNVRDLGRHTGLEVRRSFKFQAEAYPGYSHARTLGNIEGGGGGWKGEEREARSYVFQKRGPLPAQPHKAGEKRQRDSDSDSSDNER
jgi:25S rRNA (uracil2634-N3)-methyltransferase